VEQSPARNYLLSTDPRPSPSLSVPVSTTQRGDPFVTRALGCTWVVVLKVTIMGENALSQVGPAAFLGCQLWRRQRILLDLGDRSNFYWFFSIALCLSLMGHEAERVSCRARASQPSDLDSTKGQQTTWTWGEGGILCIGSQSAPGWAWVCGSFSRNWRPTASLHPSTPGSRAGIWSSGGSNHRLMCCDSRVKALRSGCHVYVTRGSELK